MPKQPVKLGADLDKALDAMPFAFLECRDYGHVWQSHHARRIEKERIYVQELMCQRCNTIRIRELNDYGHILASYYKYVDGYQMPPGTGYLTSGARDGIRLRSVVAAVENVTPIRKRKRA